MNGEERKYILISDEKSWKISLKTQIFGISEKTKGNWNTSNEGEFFAIYVMVPIGKIVGFGKILSKFVDDRLIFPDEKFFQKPLFKYRLQFEVIHIIEKWDQGISVPPEIMLNTGRRVISKKTFQDLVDSACSKWHIDLKKIEN